MEYLVMTYRNMRCDDPLRKSYKLTADSDAEAKRKALGKFYDDPEYFKNMSEEELDECLEDQDFGDYSIDSILNLDTEEMVFETDIDEDEEEDWDD